MIKRCLLLLLLLLPALPAAAIDCGSGLPCGPVPWTLPQLPVLRSPTPMPTFFYTATPSPTATPTNFTPSPTATATFTPSYTPTATATATQTDVFNVEDLQEQIATLESLLDATPLSVEMDGTPVSIGDTVSTVMPDVEDFFGRVKGVIGAEWGPFSPPIHAFLVSVFVVFAVLVLTFTMPIVGFVLGMVRKVYTAVMEFLPL